MDASSSSSSKTQSTSATSPISPTNSVKAMAPGEISSSSALSNGSNTSARLNRQNTREYDNEQIKHERVKDISEAYLSVINSIGEDATRQGLLKTPERAAKALLYFTKGYEETLSGLKLSFPSDLFKFSS